MVTVTNRDHRDQSDPTIEARRLVRARLFEAGATLSTAVFGGRQHLTAWLPNGTSDDVVAMAQADGWVVVLGRPFGWHLVKPPESAQDARKPRTVS